MNNPNNERNNEPKKLAGYLFWLLVIQGLIFVGFGILVLVYPPFLFLLVAATLLWLGISTMYLAFKWRAISKKYIPMEQAYS